MTMGRAHRSSRSGFSCDQALLGKNILCQHRPRTASALFFCVNSFNSNVGGNVCNVVPTASSCLGVALKNSS